MLFRAAATVLALCLPLTAVGQKLAPVALVDGQQPLFDRLLSVDAGPTAADGQVVPLWASPDGRLLAIVALSNGSGAPVLPPSPAFGGVSDLRIIDATSLFSAGLRLRAGEGLHADLILSRQSAPISYGQGGQAQCESGSCFGDLSSAQADALYSAGVGLGWQVANGRGVDLSFGLSWLNGGRFDLPHLGSASLASTPIDLSILDMPEIAAYKIRSGQLLSTHGAWRLGQGTTIDLSAALSRAELAPIWYGIPGAGLDWNQATLGVGIANGSLRGSIVGRINSFDEPGVAGSRRWSGIDLGVSWRTPWRGEVTVGAQNFWTAPIDAPAAAHEADASQARMPYVQYRQDL